MNQRMRRVALIAVAALIVVAIAGSYAYMKSRDYRAAKRAASTEQTVRAGDQDQPAGEQGQKLSKKERKKKNKDATAKKGKKNKKKNKKKEDAA